MMELRRALEDPAASEIQKEEWRKRLAEQQYVLQKIRAEREGAAGRSPDGTLTLMQIRSERVSPEVVKEVIDRAGITVGAPITEDAAKRVGKIATEIDEHLRANFRNDGRGGMILTLVSQ